MITRIVPAAAALTLTALAAAACGSGSTSGSPGAGGTTSAAAQGTASPEPSGTAAPPGDLPVADEPVTLDPAEMTTEIDNPYFPMEPGTRWTYRETDAEGTEQTVVVTVTDQTREIANGVTARVVRDTVTEDGALVEDTLDWYAQDAAGNVWYLGEDTAEFTDGQVSSTAGSFEAGVDGAQPGILVPADPVPGMAYRQEYYAGEAEDHGAVLAVEEQAEVPYGRFADAVLTRDTTPLDPDLMEYKLYAPGVGPVMALGISGGSSREELLTVDQAPAGFGTGPLGSP